MLFSQFMNIVSVLCFIFFYPVYVSTELHVEPFSMDHLILYQHDDQQYNAWSLGIDSKFTPHFTEHAITYPWCDDWN